MKAEGKKLKDMQLKQEYLFVYKLCQLMMTAVKQHFLELMVLIFILPLFLTAQNNPTQPTKLTVNFLLKPDLVLQNGYPVQLVLQETVQRNEKFQLIEIAHKQPLMGWLFNSSKNKTLLTAYPIIFVSSLENAKPLNSKKKMILM